MNLTHYIPAFTERTGRKEGTVCGKFIKRSEHSPAPTCPDCAAWLVEDAQSFLETIAANGWEGYFLLGNPKDGAR